MDGTQDQQNVRAETMARNVLVEPMFHAVEAENIDEAREKATREIKEKSPEIELEYRYAWKIIPSRRAEKSHAGILLFNEGEESR